MITTTEQSTVYTHFIIGHIRDNFQLEGALKSRILFQNLSQAFNLVCCLVDQNRKIDRKLFLPGNIPFSHIL